MILWLLLASGATLLVVFWSTRGGRTTAEDTAGDADSAASESGDSSGSGFLSRMDASVTEVELPKVEPRKGQSEEEEQAEEDDEDKWTDAEPIARRDRTRSRRTRVDATALAAKPDEHDAVESRGRTESRDPPSAAPPPVETNVVTLRLAGRIGSARLDPNDPFTWGRIGYFFQQDLRPRYFLVFPDGSTPAIIKGATMFKGRVVERGESLHELRPPGGPRGILGPPKYRVDLLAAVESAGAVTFYRGKIGQRYQCRLSVHISDLRGEKPSTIDSFTITEEVTRLAGGASGPPDRQTYQMAIETLVKKLRQAKYW